MPFAYFEKQAIHAVLAPAGSKMSKPYDWHVEGKTGMDVVLTPIEPANVTWSLKDRLGRSLGTVSKLADADGFKIKAQLGSSLDGVVTSHPTLDAVMTAVGKRMEGACSLDSQDWK